MSTHSRLSPSGRVRWGACPGSVREEAKFPEQESGPAALDGTRTHALLERALKMDWVTVSDLIGQNFGYDYDGTMDNFMVDADRAERVDFALRYIDARCEEIGPSATVISETRVNPAKYVGRDDLSGTVDVQIISNDTLEIIDYKDGVGVVEAYQNPQLELYALGALADSSNGMFERVRLTIIQPKLRSKKLEGVTHYDVSVPYLLAKADIIKAEAAATDAPDAPLVPGEAQCKYCRAKGACPALIGQAMTSAGIEFADLTASVSIPDPAQMTDLRIRNIMEAAPLIKSMIEGVEKEALRRFELGQTIEGLKAVRGRGGNRQWNADDEVMAEKLKKMGVPKDTLWKKTLITPTQVEKVVWEKRDGEKVQLTERQLKLISSEYVKKADGKITIVPESDERPAVQISVVPLFPVVEAPVESALPAWLL